MSGPRLSAMNSDSANTAKSAVPRPRGPNPPSTSRVRSVVPVPAMARTVAAGRTTNSTSAIPTPQAGLKRSTASGSRIAPM